jgi:hypothetical protein
VSSGDGEGMLEQPTAARPMRKTARTVTGGNHCLGMEVPTLRDVGGLTACVTCGWVGVDKTPRAGFCSGVEKCPKMAQNPTRQVHALLGRTDRAPPLLHSKPRRAALFLQVFPILNPFVM